MVGLFTVGIESDTFPFTGLTLFTDVTVPVLDVYPFGLLASYGVYPKAVVTIAEVMPVIYPASFVNFETLSSQQATFFQDGDSILLLFT